MYCSWQGNEDLGVLLLEQIPLTYGYDHERHDHVGCQEICSRTDDTGKSNNKPMLLCCKTCLVVITPKCRATIEKGEWVPDLCEPGHQYLPLRKLQHSPYSDEDANYGVTLHTDLGTQRYTGRCSYTTWSQENDGFKRAQKFVRVGRASSHLTKYPHRWPGKNDLSRRWRVSSHQFLVDKANQQQLCASAEYLPELVTK